MRQFIHKNGFPLYQEQVRNEWELLVGAILCNQSRRTPAWDSTLACILENWWDPIRLAGAPASLEELIKPHGFANTKAKRLRLMSRDFQTWDGQDPRDLYGCGQYAYDSWRIFHRGDRPRPEEVKDGALVRWLERWWAAHEGN